MNDGKTLWIGGEWQRASSGASYRSTNPASGKELADIADASPADGLRAVEAAARAFPAWRSATPSARGDVLLRAAGLLEARAAEWASNLVAEIRSRVVDRG